MFISIFVLIPLGIYRWLVPICDSNIRELSCTTTSISGNNTDPVFFKNCDVTYTLSNTRTCALTTTSRKSHICRVKNKRKNTRSYPIRVMYLTEWEIQNIQVAGKKIGATFKHYLLKNRVFPIPLIVAKCCENLGVIHNETIQKKNRVSLLVRYNSNGILDGNSSNDKCMTALPGNKSLNMLNKHKSMEFLFINGVITVCIIFLTLMMILCSMPVQTSI